METKLQTNELYSLALWFYKNIEADPVHNLYHKLHSDLKRLTAAPNQQNLRNAQKLKEDQYSSLIERLDAIDESGLTDTHKEILRDMELQSLLLSPSKEYLQNLLILPQDNAYVVSTLKTGTDRIAQAVNAFKGLRIQMETVLAPVYLDATDIPDNKCLTRLRFHNNAAIDNVVDLKDWSKTWHTIARGFSIAVNQAPEDFEIVSTDKGSVIVDLMLNIEVVKLVTETLKAMAELATELITLKMGIEGVKALKGKMDEKTYNTMLEQVTENVRKDEEQLIENVVEHLKEQNLVMNEHCHNELVSAIKELTKYNQKGGSIHCISTNKNKTTSEALNSNFKQLQDKSELKLIEDKQDLVD